MNKLFGLSFYDGDIKNLVDELDNKVSLNEKAAIFTPNVDHIINNSIDEYVKDIYSSAEYTIADGWPLVATGKMKKKSIQRITGVDLMDELLELSNKKKYKIYFLGATDETLKKLKRNINKKYPKIENIIIHNGYFKDNKKIIKEINENDIDILFVGMGNPKQELWIKENFKLINAKLMLGVGGAFKIFSEEVDRAPKVVQKIGLEWFYRFLKEPKRLFERYFLKYPKFIWIFIKEMFR